jgi:hypothetical protein
MSGALQHRLGRLECGPVDLGRRRELASAGRHAGLGAALALLAVASGCRPGARLDAGADVVAVVIEAAARQ